MRRLRRRYLHRLGRRQIILSSLQVRNRFLFFALLISGIFVVTSFSRYLGEVSGQMAATEAKDIVVLAVSEAISNMIDCGEFSYSSFVAVEKDVNGNVTAITTDTARVNSLSSQLLTEVVGQLGQGKIDIKVPVGTLSGLRLFQGRGPDVPVKIHLLTASHANFRNELMSAGINQTRHQIILDVTININVLIPWKSLDEQVVSEVLVAETVIVGKVPDTVIDWK
jgi:sporulation protein YunB